MDLGNVSFFHFLGGPLDAITISPDHKMFAVGGREVFKIISFENEQFQEKLNLKKGRYQQLTKTVVDLEWHYKKMNVLASAPTNGSLVIWDLLDQQGSMTKIYSEHSRTINKIAWRPLDEHVIISASQDGTIKLWDIRQNESCGTFEMNSEVRTIKWNPFQTFQFASGYDSGALLIWDIRKTDKMIVSMKSAHNGVIHTLDWHPLKTNRLASGSRDLLIKVWDLPEDKPKITIQTIATISSILWRPNFANEVCSSSNVIDYSAHIWDINSHYIPKYSFENHKDVITDMLWYKNDSETLVTCSKDGTIFMQKVKNAIKPYERVCPTSVSWGVKDQLVHYSPVKKEKFEVKKSVDLNRNNFEFNKNSNEIMLKNNTSIDIQKEYSVPEDIYLYQEISDSKSLNMIYYAKKFKIFGNESIEEKCLHNAKVCEDNSDESKKLTWLILSALSFPEKQEKQDIKESKDKIEVKEELIDSSRETSPFIRGQEKQIFITPKSIEIEIQDEEPNLESIVLDTLDYYCEDCDVQMCFAISYIFKSKVGIEHNRLLDWQQSYIDLLNRFKEFCLSAQIIKYSSKASKHYPLIDCCGKCGKNYNGNRCQCDTDNTHTCIICRLPVKGLFLWFFKCGHGGHVEHIQNWIKYHNYCPSCSLPLNQLII